MYCMFPVRVGKSKILEWELEDGFKAVATLELIPVGSYLMTNTINMWQLSVLQIF